MLLLIININLSAHEAIKWCQAGGAVSATRNITQHPKTPPYSNRKKKNPSCTWPEEEAPTFYEEPTGDVNDKQRTEDQVDLSTELTADHTISF